MSLYEVAKDALTLAKKADNIELVQKLLDVQSTALDMQNKLQEQNATIIELKENIKKLKNQKKYIYETGHKWYINSDNPDIKFCPTCLNRDNFESPLGSAHNEHRYCGNCKNSVN